MTKRNRVVTLIACLTIVSAGLIGGFSMRGTTVYNPVNGKPAFILNEPTAAAQSSSAAPIASAAPTATATVAPTATAAPSSTTNPSPVHNTGQPSMADVTNVADITAKCDTLLPKMRQTAYFYGKEESGAGPFLIKVCNNPDFISERRGTYSFDGNTVRMGLEGDQTCSNPVNPHESGPRALYIGEWTSGTGTEVFFKKHEGGSKGTLVNPQVVFMTICAAATPTYVPTPVKYSKHHRSEAPPAPTYVVIMPSSTSAPPIPTATAVPTATVAPPIAAPLKDPRFGL